MPSSYVCDQTIFPGTRQGQNILYNRKVPANSEPVNAEAEIIPSIQLVWDREVNRFVFRSIALWEVDQILKLAECPCDPKLKQERAGQRIAIQ